MMKRKHKKNNYIQSVFLGILLLSIPMGFVSLKKVKQDKKLVEKIYTHTDRPFYFPGETIWFKSYVTDLSNEVSTISEIVYADLISPKGSVVKKLQLDMNLGAAYGDFYINEDWVGGIYTLKVYTNWMRNYGEDAFFTKKITVQKVVKPRLLMKLDFEKESYGSGSQVVANIEMKDLKNKPLSNKEINYTLAISGTKKLKQQITLNEKGKAAITFQLPANLTTSDVVLNVLVSYKLATESISRSVPIVLDNIDFQFFPESGNALQNIENTIAFKAVNEYGKPADVSGNIINNEGQLVAKFTSYHDGMGSFQLKPQKGKQYYAEITAPFTSKKKYHITKIKENGITFSLKQTTKNIQLMRLYTSASKNVVIQVSNANKALYEKQKVISGKASVYIDTEHFPMGITKFTVLDLDNTPLCERLRFINPKKQLNVDVTLDKEVYQTRKK